MSMWLVISLLGCGARSGLLDPEPSREDAGPRPTDSGRPRRDAGPPVGLDAGGPFRCTVGERFDVIRDDLFGPVTGLDLARSERELALFFLSGVDPIAFVARLDTNGGWTGSATGLGAGGPGSIARGSLDGPGGYTVVYARPDGLVGAILEESGSLLGTSMHPGPIDARRPAIAVSERAMIVAWAGDGITQALITDLETLDSQRLSFEGSAPAAAIFAGVEPELVVSLGTSSYYRRIDTTGLTRSEHADTWMPPHEVVGFDMASTIDDTAILRWSARFGVPIENGSFALVRGRIGHGELWDRARPVDGAVAFDEPTNSVLSALSLTDRRVVAQVVRSHGFGSDRSDELEIGTAVTASIGDAPTVATVSLGGSFLVVWDDVLDGRDGISGRTVTCTN